MDTVVGILLFLLLGPLLGGGLQGLRAVISAKLQGEAPRHILHGFIDLITACRRPWTESRSQRLCAISRPLLTLAGGVVFFTRGNIALVFSLLIFAKAVETWGKHDWRKNSSGMKLERDIAWDSVLISQLFLIAAGFYCYIAIESYQGNFLVADIMSADMAPAFYMPLMLLGFIWLLLRESSAGFQLHKEGGEDHGKEQALLIIGGWYRTVVLYAVLFLFNYSGTVFSTVISIAICLLVWLFGLLLQKPHSQPPEPATVSVISAVLLLASFINLFVLLP